MHKLLIRDVRPLCYRRSIYTLNTLSRAPWSVHLTQRKEYKLHGSVSTKPNGLLSKDTHKTLKTYRIQHTTPQRHLTRGVCDDVTSKFFPQCFMLEHIFGRQSNLIETAHLFFTISLIYLVFRYWVAILFDNWVFSDTDANGWAINVGLTLLSFPCSTFPMLDTVPHKWSNLLWKYAKITWVPSI